MKFALPSNENDDCRLGISTTPRHRYNRLICAFSNGQQIYFCLFPLWKTWIDKSKDWFDSPWNSNIFHVICVLFSHFGFIDWLDIYLHTNIFCIDQLELLLNSGGYSEFLAKNNWAWLSILDRSADFKLRSGLFKIEINSLEMEQRWNWINLLMQRNLIDNYSFWHQA